MRFQTPLLPATLIRRYKRFLADIRLDDGREAVAHCPSSGSMLGLAEPGTRIWVEPNDDPARKLKFGWRLVEHESGHFTGIDTGLPNRALRAALMAGRIAGLAEYGTVLPEQRYGSGSRIDFLLRQDGLPDAYVEVKSVTLSRAPGLAEFPDSVTARGAKHLDALAGVAAAGRRAVLFYLVQRTDCSAVGVAADIDPAYAAAHQRARAAGVETLARDTRISPRGVSIGQPLPLRQGSGSRAEIILKGAKP